MPWEAWLTLTVVVVMLVGLLRSWTSPDALVLGSLTVLILAGALAGTERLPTPSAAIAGFGNAGPVTVGVLFTVVAGLVHTGATDLLAQSLVGRPKTVLAAQVRLLIPVWLSSAFLNNTPVVAMFMPVVSDLERKHGIAVSKLFIPLSYFSILGGLCTLIGTSTNLVVHGLVIQSGIRPEGLGMFEITLLGVPVAVVGIAFILASSRYLLPERTSPIGRQSDPRQYTAEMVVTAGGPVAGKTVEAAGLRHLPGLFLAEIERDGQVIPAVGPKTLLAANDQLVFVGAVDSVLDLRRMRGLRPATNQVFRLNGHTSERQLIEAVVADTCPLVGLSIREGRFRSRYNAVIIALARGGQRLQGKIGDAVLSAGDTLLLETDDRFLRSHRRSPDFHLVSPIAESAAPRHDRAWVALVILGLMILAAAFEWVSMLAAALGAAALMLLARCMTPREARQSVDWSVLVVIGAALGLGQALTLSGASEAIARALISLAGGHPWSVLLAVHLTTMMFTEVITNNAAVALVFPIAVASAQALGVNPMPFIFCIMIAGSASFATPIGYQTNLMVYGPGGYRFTDFLRIGLPLNLLVMTVSVTLAPLIWPF